MQQGRAFISKYTAHVPNTVVGALGVKIFRAGNNRASQGIRRAVHNSGHPRVDKGGGAHGAGLKRNHQHAPVEPVIAKGRTGGGLGLFLVVNVARKLGGTVTARNRPGRGATVTLTLPLAAIAIGEEPEERDDDAR